MRRTYDIRGYESDEAVDKGKFVKIADGITSMDEAMRRAKIYVGYYKAVKVHGLGFVMIFWK